VVADRDRFYMGKALRLAERGRATTAPNPMVGALVVDREGVIVGRGAHAVAGGPHAEILALHDAGARIRGATLYCTLEPCSHTGRTGPCAPVVAASGVSRVVTATEDPNPRVAGRGHACLRDRGIAVTSGVQEAAARRLNEAFFTAMRLRRPFVTMKVATSLDGFISASPSTPIRLTGPAADRLVHRDRAEVDALAIGSGTLLADDPRLTPRLVFRQRPLTRIVFDRRLRTPPSARLFSTLATGPVIIVTAPIATSERLRAADELRAAGATIDEACDDDSLASTLERLTAGGIQSLIVEGGTRLHRAFWDAGLVDRVQIYVAPREVGSGGWPWLAEPVIAADRIAQRWARPVGDDVLIEAYVHGAH
jgi:diaminohydroxyphosphoribosylaminopyrimidine deaminase / 5-amino-6-(5-phosphoribosylamino)uracil reductase